ncbi:MAG: zinc ABC transporter substrate-binding protein [Pseudomonadota bacterium]
MRSLIAPLTVAATLGLVPLSAKAEAPEVVVSIKPLHGLTAAIMEGAGTPTLMLDGVASPHGYRMRPSDAQNLQSADLVVWVGPSLETFLIEPLETLSPDAAKVTALDLPGLKRLPTREGGVWAAHDHDHGHGHDHGEEKDAHHHDDDDHHHGDEAHHHDDDDDHQHDEEAHHHDDDDDHHHGEEAHHHEEEDAHHHDDDHAHDHGEKAHHEDDDHHHGDEAHHHDGEGHTDPHVWLSPANAQIIAAGIAAQLAELDPSNAALYQSNLESLEVSLSALDEELRSQLSGLEDRRFIVFHDAYAYFEDAYGLNPVGSVTVSPEQRPGARRLAELRDVVEERGAVCLFAEPQFESGVIDALAEGTQVSIGRMDPLGVDIPAGPGAYQALMTELSSSTATCLTPTN